MMDFLLNRLIQGSTLGQKIQNEDDVSDKGQYALDAMEKNPNVENTLASQITDNTNSIARVKNTVDSIISLPDDASTAADGEIAAAKVGPKGEQYNTLQDAISQQIQDYKGLKVSGSTPSTDSNVDVWLNTSDNDGNSGYEVPQIDDNSISTVDTWSSAKIRKAITDLVKSVVGSEGSSAIVAELIDDMATEYDTTWSSSKINSVITDAVGNVDLSSIDNKINKLTGSGDGSIDAMIDTKINAFATRLTDDGTVNTYSEALNWIATHAGDYTALLGEVSKNTTDLAKITSFLNGGTEGQFAVSDGNGGFKWITIGNAESIEF